MARYPIFAFQKPTPEAVTDGESRRITIANIVKPILFDTEFLSIRNAKIGLATLDCRTYPGLNIDAAIVLGNMHDIGMYPGMYKNETVQDAKKRMIRYLTEKLIEVTDDIHRTSPNIPSEDISAVLSYIFSKYTVYDFPQFPVGKPPPWFKDEYFRVHWTGSRTIPEMDKAVKILS
jgi:hypothetical protein